MRTALANKKLNDYVIEQDEVNFEQEIMTQVRQFEMLRLQIEITKKADEVATERYNVAQNRYLIGKIDITNLNIALTEKDDAKRSYIQALKKFLDSLLCAAPFNTLRFCCEAIALHAGVIAA